VGFADLLAKPMRIDQLAAALGLDAVAPAHPEPPQESIAANADLDDAQAIRALGSIEAVADLRRLLAAELPGQLDALQTQLTTGRVDDAQQLLHRLKGSTRFCGAPRLFDAADLLGMELRRGIVVSDVPHTLLDAARAYLDRVTR
jgi:two-component system sensor histidine kinase BarA